MARDNVLLVQFFFSRCRYRRQPRNGREKPAPPSSSREPIPRTRRLPSFYRIENAFPHIDANVFIKSKKKKIIYINKRGVGVGKDFLRYDSFGHTSNVSPEHRRERPVPRKNTPNRKRDRSFVVKTIITILRLLQTFLTHQIVTDDF